MNHNTALAELDGWVYVSEETYDLPDGWVKEFHDKEIIRVTSADHLPRYLSPAELRDNLVVMLEDLNYLHAAALVKWYPLTK